MMGETIKRNDGYSESENYYIVPAFGHLFSLNDIEEYNPQQAEKTYWNMEQLPFFPEEYQFSLKKDMKTKAVDTGVKKQFQTIKRLIDSNDTESIVHCGDSDREGEIIVRIILKQAGNTKPVYRLWLPDQVEKTIIQSLSSMELDSVYDRLAEEGYARTYIDWNYGINLTRYATLKCNTLLKVGRVVSAIVKTIYDRDKEIEQFVPQKYLGLTSKEKTKNEVIELTSATTYPTVNDIEACKALCAVYNQAGARVTDIKTEEKIIQSPKLFSQSGLQNVLSKKYKYSPDKTLSLVQSLYEKGYVSYPRTPTEYLATAEKPKVQEIISTIKAKGTTGITFKDTKRIFDDSKIESHSAITPTIKIPDLSTLTTDERNCYETIFNRFCSVFCEEDCRINQTLMTISIGDVEQFVLKGNVGISKGWKQFEAVEEKEKELPSLAVDDEVVIKFMPVEKETQPKKHFTVETLNNYLKNPFREESKQAKEADESDYQALFDGLEIGTEATRPSIIAGAIKSGYIALDKVNYIIQDKGKYYIESLDKLGIDMSKEKTVFLGKTLKEVYKGTKTIQESLTVVNNEIKSIIDKDCQVQKMASPAKAEIGKCPVCGKAIYETPKAYSCNGGIDGCGYVLWKGLLGKQITEAQAKKLFQSGKTDFITGLQSKSGKLFTARLVLKGSKTEFEFKQ